jgi:hypothetical protein
MHGISEGYGMKRYVWDQWWLWNEEIRMGSVGIMEWRDNPHWSHMYLFILSPPLIPYVSLHSITPTDPIRISSFHNPHGVMEWRDTYGISGGYGIKRYVWDQWGLWNEEIRMGSVMVMEWRDTYGISGGYGMKRYVWDQWVCISSFHNPHWSHTYLFIP